MLAFAEMMYLGRQLHCYSRELDFFAKSGVEVSSVLWVFIPLSPVSGA